MTPQQEQFWIDTLANYECDDMTIAQCIAKMNQGNQKYGDWNPESESRNFSREIYNEILDAINYAIMGLYLEQNLNIPCDADTLTDVLSYLYEVLTLLRS